MTTRLQTARAAAIAAVQTLVEASDDDLTSWDACAEDGVPAEAQRRHDHFRAVLASLMHVPETSAAGVPDATRAMTARIVAERVRQQTDEGRTPDWDDRHTTGGLARAAACYALQAGASASRLIEDVNALIARFWPWDMKAWKPADPMRNLEKAGALILAEMERLARS